MRFTQIDNQIDDKELKVKLPGSNASSGKDKNTLASALLCSNTRGMESSQSRLSPHEVPLIGAQTTYARRVGSCKEA